VASWWSLAQERGLKTRRALLFQLGGITYGIAVEFVEKVIEVSDITPVPRGAAWTVGVVVHDLLPYPLIDVRRFLQPETTVGHARLPRAIVINSAHGKVLLGVEQLVTISDLGGHSRVEAPRSEYPSEYMEYVCRSDAALIGVVSVPRLLLAASRPAGRNH
jgi:chemotaxis signal transduction protein